MKKKWTLNNVFFLSFNNYEGITVDVVTNIEWNENKYKFSSPRKKKKMLARAQSSRH